MLELSVFMEEKITKLIEAKALEIRALCNDGAIPYFMAFGFPGENGKLKTCAYTLLPEEFREKDDRHLFSDLVNVYHGKATVTIGQKDDAMVETDFGIPEIMKSVAEDDGNAHDTVENLPVDPENDISEDSTEELFF